MKLTAIALFMAFATVSGAENVRTDPFELPASQVTIRWEAEARSDSTCYFNAALLRLEGGEVAGFWRIANVTIHSAATAAMFGGEDRDSGEVRIDVPAGDYVFDVLAQHMRYADGSTEGCESYRVTFD